MTNGEQQEASGNASWYDGMRSYLAQPSAWPADKERVILEPYAYLAACPGKEIRSKLIDAFNVWLRLPSHKLEVVTRVVGMLHTASLLMDDVEDNSDLRRGIPVAHKIYGIPQTINTANYVYFQVFSLIFSLGPPGAGTSATSTPVSSSADTSTASEASSVERLVVDELIALHRGQGMDLFWRDNLVCPTEAEYVDMVNNKTGGLLRIALKLMLAHSPLYASSAGSTSAQEGAREGGPPDLIPLVNLIGLLFQIRDDYMNLQSADYAHNKGFAEDLTEGKFSFPIIHSIRTSEPVPLGSEASSSTSRTAEPAAGTHGGTKQLFSAGHSTTTAAAAAGGGGNRQLLSILRQRPTDFATKQYAVSYMRTQTRSFAYTRDVMTRLDRLVHSEIQACERTFAKLQQGSAGVGEAAAGNGSNPALGKIVAALREGWWGVQEED